MGREYLEEIKRTSPDIRRLASRKCSSAPRGTVRVQWRG